MVLYGTLLFSANYSNHQLAKNRLDPYSMFPHKEKSALVKKDMQILQDIAEQDVDADALLHLALSIATNRVVVKRPSTADFLAGIKPQTSIKTKKHRFDIYLTPQP